ncbi:ELAV-like protein 1-like protein [Aphelenchoides avenae]|nr:ELAV-like protein 1-like protein [Aphelenchus avenae]
MLANITLDPASTIRVSYLPPEVNRKSLKETFGGSVRHVRVAYNWETGEPLEPGHAFVAFASPEQAKMAMSRFGGRVTTTGDLTVDWQKNIAYGHNSRAPMIIVIFLPPDIADDRVRAMFERHGEILTFDVIEDRHTGVTVCKVRYLRVENAEHAIDALDGRLIGGTAIRVLWAHKSRPKGYDVKIELLPDHVDRKMLKERLECYGNIRRAEVQYDWKTGDSLKHAYVTFAKEEEAEAATSAFCGRRRRQGIWVVDWCTSFVLVVIGLPEQAAEGALRELFSEIGEITTIQSVHDHRTGAFMRHAFVSFARLRDAERAVEELDGVDLGSGPIRILWKDTSFPNGYDVQVRKLGPETDRKDLKEMFSQFGDVIRAEISYNWTTGKSHRCGYVRYATHVEATAAMRHFGGHTTPKGIFVVYLPSETADAIEPVVLHWKRDDSLDDYDSGNGDGEGTTSASASSAR